MVYAEWLLGSGVAQMDKLRALEYFLTAAEERSFSRAARKLQVSVPAVVKLVNVLEAQLGAVLFERSVRGLKLTAGGERYWDACQPLLTQLVAADQLLDSEASRLRGTIVLAAHPELVMLPWLSRFHGAYPDIQIDIRNVTATTIQTVPADVYLVHGWPSQVDMVRRVVAQPRLVTCAAPTYWAKYGVPQRPEDLADHVCLLYCNDLRTVNDLWKYERSGKTVSVTALGWLVSNNRAITLNAAVAGEGVVRIADLFVIEQLRSGALVPVLTDWNMADSPPFNLMYSANQRRNRRARIFIDFVTNAFRELEAQAGYGSNTSRPSERPRWSKRGLRRASAAL
jgi:LysR family transcriptional regulator, regulator for bpeEF and oprC